MAESLDKMGPRHGRETELRLPRPEERDGVRALGLDPDRPVQFYVSGPRPVWRVNEVGDHVCEHGTAADVHCCNCHSGFMFWPEECICASE